MQLKKGKLLLKRPNLNLTCMHGIWHPPNAPLWSAKLTRLKLAAALGGGRLQADVPAGEAVDPSGEELTCGDELALPLPRDLA